MENTLNQEVLSRLRDAVGEAYLHTGLDVRRDYGHDETEDLSFPPQVVIKPADTAQVSQIMKIASEFRIPVTPIGGRTGLSGGALSIMGGIGLSMERFNRILDIDERNFQVTVQPGVITQVLREAVAERGLFYPPDPSSMGSCFIGGNVSENAGGARALKYGVTRDYVLNLEVVLPSGEIINTGANTLKNSTGYNLTQLVAGSEGTLGVITKIVMKLLPAVPHNVLMLVPFHDAGQACEAVAEIFRIGIVPSALEFMERDAIDWTLRFVDNVSLVIDDRVEAHLLVEVDGSLPDVLFGQAEQIANLLEKYEIGEILFADTEDQKNALWKLRRAVGEAVKSNSVYKEEDTVVPRYELPRLLRGIKEIGNRYGFRSVCYGHAGDGNLHVNIVKGEMDDLAWTENVPKGVREIFQLTVSLGGTLSGEHGIGFVQKNYMDIAFSRSHLELFKGIKQVFDPLNIMNPGKILPDHL